MRLCPTAGPSEAPPDAGVDAAAERAIAERGHILLVEDIFGAREQLDRVRQRKFGAQVDERIIVEPLGVARIVIALARPAHRGTEGEPEIEAIACRGVGGVARTAR